MSKKNIIDFGFAPSPYQEKIFDFVQHGVGNAVISATAGSGKTSSAVAAMKLIPKTKKCLFIAFNKSIVEELNKRLESYDNVTVRTAHSLGRLMIMRNLGSDIEIDEYKYRTYLKNNINDLTSISDETKLTNQMIDEYIESISMLIDYSRFNTAQSVKEIEEVAIKYDIPVSFDECEVALKCLEWGRENYHTIDYTDMIWLPFELSLRPVGLQFDWVVVDECQDMSLLTIQLFLKCFKRGSRFLAIGDFSQAIYGFAGSSEDAFEFMKSYPNTTVFDLPISYRCARNITKFANNIVPEMQCRDDAPDGNIVDKCTISMIKEGDMVLSRTKAPLVKLYIKLLRRGVNCFIKGKDIGSNLIKLLESIDLEELNTDLKNDGVFVRLYDRLFIERNSLVIKRGLDLNDATTSMNVMNIFDSINALAILAEKCNTKEELISNIEMIFQDEAQGVCLSTIHKAKGLESDRVFILCHSTMPSKMAHHDWEKIQEKNLQFVAYTRAKNFLGFVSEDEIKPYGDSSDSSALLTELGFIEKVVCRILGKEPMQDVDNAELAKFNLRNATKIEDLHTNVNHVTLDIKIEDKDLLNELMEFIKKT